MASDFFERQEAARRNTTRLVLLFAAAVLGMIVAINLLLAAALGLSSRDPANGAVDWSLAVNPQLWLIATVATLVVVGGGSAFKIVQLRGGGRVVAESLGGRLLNADTAVPAERQLLNVVEEMAIASGIASPDVYLMENETAINAFAAGFTPADAVIGVTRGAIDNLSRDELQGVIAHEFSHIFNGDMRLNIRLIGLLAGILIVGTIGYFVLRSAAFSGGRRRSRDNNPMPLLVIGAGLMAIGFVGTFFGNLIKAAVSRQREFLADASAVQFTRQPHGIAGALRKIGGLSSGSQIQSPNAPDASHLFFSRATSGVSALFSTHPPLPERIRRIDPAWDGTFPESPQPAAVDSSGADGSRGAVSGLVDSRAGQPTTTAAGLLSRVGQPDQGHLAYAARLLAGLPPEMTHAAHEPYGARALVYALLLDKQADARRVQLEHLSSAADSGVFKDVRALVPVVDSLERRVRLPLVELALPALRTLTADQYARFRKSVSVLVEFDRTINLFEWALQRTLLRDLDQHFDLASRPVVRHHALEPLLPHCEVILSVLAALGTRGEAARGRAFDLAKQALGAPALRLRPAAEAGLGALDRALTTLEEAAPDVKRKVTAAAAACITADGRVSDAEAEVLRALAASLGCPIPPTLSD